MSKLGLFLILALVSLSSLAVELDVLETIPLSHPRNMEISPDGSELYVQYGEAPQQIAVISTASNTILDSIVVSGGYQMDMSPDGSRLYIGGNGLVEVVDLVTRNVLSLITIPGAGNSLSGVAVSPDGSEVYVTDRGLGTGYVYVINTASLSYSDTIIADPYGWPFVMGIDVAPSGDFAYVSSRKYGHLDVIDLTSNLLLTTVPQGFGASSILTNVTVTADGTRAYVTNVQYSFISVVDINPVGPTFHQEVAWFDTGASGLGNIEFSQDGTQGFVTDGPWGANRIFIIDTDPASPTYHSVLDDVEVGNWPWDAIPHVMDNQVAYVSVWDPDATEGGNVAIIGYPENPAPVISCAGFQPPAEFGPITVKKNRAIPFKAELFGEDGFEITATDLAAAPVIQVHFTSADDGTPVDVTDDALPAGASSEGNVFEFTGDHWRYNLMTSNYTAAGTYLVSMESGDSDEYVIAPTCEVSFVIE
jgi:DNA-binding beta-propeller fold protein YncE